MARVLFGFFIIVFIVSCSSGPAKSIRKHSSTIYAKGFETEDFDLFRKVTVYNPWEQASDISFTYYLFPKGAVVPDSLKGQRIIFTPVERVICFSTSHIAFLDALGETSRIKGISGAQYVNNQKVRDEIESGEVVDVGYDSGLNYEIILQQKPELILVYGIGSEVTTYARKMEDLGLNVFFVAEYLEESPLGKAEWIKCLAPLFNKENQAELFFSEVESNYKKLLKKASQASEKPNIMVGLPYRDSWWIPGGKSYLANLISDAGGIYVGRENDSHESFVVSFENALIMAEDIDVWINTGSVFTKNEIIAADERFISFPAFKNAQIYNNNKCLNPSGGNDFWESGTVYPDRILHDFIAIFHPGILDDSDLFYYRKLD
ncbi:MAG: ABC transporter substrate-binding protein [Prolixibacteraceae bacterium]|nr:ABC transporter substrate-binding protein [Prolixibacteraceae bacterium]MBN2772755.1 ABC transporter substrate-binding protein [Prolixibacteraceae bacterium]